MTAVGQPYLEALQTRSHLDVTVTGMDSSHTVYIDRPGQTGAVVQEFLG